MKISRNSAKSLCTHILQSLETWEALAATLQCGAQEDKARGRIGIALEAWVKASHRKNLLVLPEYRPPMVGPKNHIDFALIHPASVGKCALDVDALFEVKSNYTNQITATRIELDEVAPHIPGDLKRLPDAIGQARTYKREVGAKAAYVIYLVMDCVMTKHHWTTLENKSIKRDNGWQYHRRADTGGGTARSWQNARAQISKVARRFGHLLCISEASLTPIGGKELINIGCAIIRV